MCSFLFLSIVVAATDWQAHGTAPGNKGVTTCSIVDASSPATGLNMGPTAGNGAELQFAFAPFHAPELPGLNLVFQILCGFEERGFERVVSGLGAQGRAMNQQRRLARVAGGLGVHAR